MHLHNVPIFENSEHVCVWGFEDFGRLSEGHQQTWLPLCHPEETDISYEKATGEVYVRCRLCSGMNKRFAVAA
jgi:hypothetical protein